MSAIQNNSLLHIKNLDLIHPLNKNTEKTLKQYAFGSTLSGGCFAYQTLAERVEYLKDLQSQFDKETIDLAWGDRRKAVLKCMYKAFLATTLLISGLAVIALGILTLASPVGIFSTPSTWLILLKSSLIVISGKVLGALAYQEYTKMVKACQSAKQIFARPTANLLTKELNNISTKEMAPEEIDQMIALEELLREKIKELNKSFCNISKTGANIEQPEKEIQSIELALADVRRLRIAISG
jgi:hypothetical protein